MAQSVLPILEITRLFQSIVDPLQMVLLGLIAHIEQCASEPSID